MLITDPTRLAADARSILACPATVTLVVEGEPQAVDEETGLADEAGTPTFVCRQDSPVARAAGENRSAILTVTSGLGPAGSLDRDWTLTLAGRLERTGVEDCDCCQETRDVVALDLNFVLIDRGTRQHRVPLEEFRSPAHDLNRGSLQRSTEHANTHHQDELRHAVAHGTGTRPSDLLGVQLARVTPREIEVQWVDSEGAHQRTVVFPRPARDLAELGDLLRRSLHHLDD